MVFELTDTLINDAVVNDANLRHALYNLFLGYEEGNLLLSASPELLEFLSQHLSDSLSKRIINHLQHKVLAHYSVLWQIKVVLENPNDINHEISLDFFRESSAIQPPTILCENLDDVKFYSLLCREYFGEQFINTKNGRGAGGSSIADELEAIITNNDRFCICIVDSDIKYKNAPVGGTYQSIINKNLKPNATYQIYKLNVHEIENLIPIDVIVQHIKAEKDRNFAKRLKKIDNKGDILFYYDIKEGIQLSLVKKLPDYSKFAEDIYMRLKRPSCKTTFTEYIDSLVKRHKETVFASLRPGVLDAVLRSNSHRKARFIYCEYLRDEWERIRAYMVTFLCCRQDEPIN